MRILQLGLLLAATAAWAQGPRNVLLVVNGNSVPSRTIGEYYQTKRAIPASNVCTLAVQTSERIDRASFEKAIRQPIAKCIVDARLQDRILYIVLTKGIPLVLKTAGTKPSDDSVDSELTLLYVSLLGVNTSGSAFNPGKIANPYFARNANGEAARFSHREFRMYLVTRLDGYDTNDAKSLVDRGLAASGAVAKDGRFVLDRRAEENDAGNAWLSDAATNLRAAGIPAPRIELESTAQFLTGQDKVIGYASYGSNDPGDRSRYLKHRWLPGGLMAEFVSTDARTFERPPDNWNIGSWKDSRRSFFHDSPQSLIGDAIHEGVTGVSGNVAEPLLDACVRPQILFAAYVRGLNLAESFYAAMPYLNWKGVVIGDPLVSPFARSPLPAAEADPAVDRALGAPVFFAKHLVETRARLIGEKPEVVALMMAADRAMRSQDRAAARQAAERAYKLSPDSYRTTELMAQLSPVEQAIPLYRKVLEIAPRDPGALNNLAYMLAETNRAKEALPLAARAVDVTEMRNAPALDTYGWVLYLLGQYPEACKMLDKSMQMAPAIADTVYHVGMCDLKAGRIAEGRAQLERARTLNPNPATAAHIAAQLAATTRKAQ